MRNFTSHQNIDPSQHTSLFSLSHYLMSVNPDLCLFVCLQPAFLVFLPPLRTRLSYGPACLRNLRPASGVASPTYPWLASAPCCLQLPPAFGPLPPHISCLSVIGLPPAVNATGRAIHRPCNPPAVPATGRACHRPCMPPATPASGCACLRPRLPPATPASSRAYPRPRPPPAAPVSGRACLPPHLPPT